MIQLALLLVFSQQPSVETLSRLAKSKDIVALSKFSTGDGKEFNVLKGGSYEVGKFGWKAEDLAMPEVGKFVVFTTPLTSQDIGELLFERVGSKLKFIDEQAKDGLRLRHHKVRVNFKLDKKEAHLIDEVAVEVAQNEQKFHALRFSPCYKVGSISEGTSPVMFQQSGGMAMIPKLSVGKHTLTIKYTAVVDLPGYAGSISPKLATLTNDYWYPMVNRMPTTYEIAVVPPEKEWTVVAQGNYVGREKDTKEPAELFKVDMPTIYWSLTVLKTNHVEEMFDGRKLQMWSPRVPTERMALQPKLYAPIIKLFDKDFGKFPFDSYGALDSPAYGGGALEAYSYATYGGGLPEEDAHEPSHTWWGGILPNTYLKSFWNESFAVWSSGYFAREVPIGNAFDRREAFQTVSMPEDDYNDATLMNSGVASGTAGGSLGYGKGSLVLSMLEQLVGTTNFVQCLNEWVRIHPKGEPAEWEEFEAVVTRRLAQYQLKDFFDDWFRRPGFANITFQGGKYTTGKFVGKLAWNGRKFRMPIELWFENKGGGRQVRTLDTKDVDGEGRFTISMQDFRPNKVYFDPYHRALRVGPPPNFSSFADVSSAFQIVRDANHPEYLQQLGQSKGNPTLESLDKKFLIGHPSTMPKMKDLCIQAGFSVNGDILTFQGTTINLNEAAAVAIVELGDGKQCAIGLGKCLMEPNLGNGFVGVVDSLGRMLRGKTHFPADPSAGLPI